ncbi:MAG: deoxyribose-phosphate aldolase [Flavobacteriaceae bacterium]|nr:deoxyribose-phosphate aldolase [Flavobacteriaceae bacterium]
MRYLFYTFLIAIFVSSCQTEAKLTADEIINRTIAVSGGEKYLNVEIEFNFRDKHYRSIRENGEFQYEREFQDSLGMIRDVLNNESFQRFVNNEIATIPDSMAVKYTSSVNSVHYFALLPYGLNDGAVHKSDLGEVTIKTKKYHKIKVWFSEDGGGEDFEDVFIYWIDTDTFKVDYIAYSYIEDDGIGIRFREAYNERMIQGIRFMDYNNYKSEDIEMKLLDLAKAFEKGNLSLLSKIELEDIQVK